MQHEGSSSLDEAFGLLVAVVRDYSGQDRRAIAASLKPALQTRSLGGFSERDLGFEGFRQFLRAAERQGLVTLVPSGVDLEVRLPGSSESSVQGTGILDLPVESISHNRQEAHASIREDFWRAFVDWNPGWKRFYRTDADQAVMFPENPVPLEPKELTTLRTDWKTHPERYLPITPVAQEIHVGWMRAFAHSVKDQVARRALELALSDERPAAAFMRTVRASPRISAEWRAKRLDHVLAVIGTWVRTNGLDVQYTVVRPRYSDSAVGVVPKIDGHLSDRVRATFHRAIDKMPLNELLQLRIPAEYIIDL